MHAYHSPLKFCQILTVAVLAVVLTAPLGALATSLLGPIVLKKATPTSESDDGTRPDDKSPLPEASSVLPPPHEATEIPSEPSLDAKSGSYEG